MRHGRDLFKVNLGNHPGEEPPHTEADQEYRILLDESSDPIFSFYADGTYRYVNQAFAEGVGKPVEDIIGKKLWDVFSKDEADKRFAALKSVFQTGTEKIIEVRVPRPDGDRYYITTIKPIKDRQGKVTSAICVSKEITERKWIEEALRRSEKMYRSVIENIQDVFYRSDKEGRVVMGSLSGVEMFGYVSMEEMVGLPLESFWMEPAKRQLLVEEIRKNGEVRDFEALLKKKDGTPFVGSFTSHFYCDEDGNILGTEGILRDITARKAMEEALRESEQKYRQLLELAHEGIWSIDKNEITTYVNPRVAEMLGYSVEEMLGTSLFKYADDAGISLLEEQLERRKNGLRETYEMEFIRKDGGRIYTNISASPILDSGGNYCGSLALLADLTDRRRVEKLSLIQRDLGIALSKTVDLTEALNRVLETAFLIEGIDCGGIYLVDSVSGDLFLAAHKGFPLQFVESVSHYAADSPQARWLMERTPYYGQYGSSAAEQNRMPGDEELLAVANIPILHDDQAIAIFSLASRTQENFIPDTRAALEAVATQVGDAIARLRAEAALDETSTNLQALFDTIGDFLLIVDSDGKILKTNPVVLERLGYTHEEMAGMHILDIHPPRLRKETAEIIAGMIAGRVASCSIPLITKNGNCIPVETKVCLGRWGNKLAMFGISRDVTERMQMENALRESERRFRAILNNIPDLAWLKGVDNRYVAVNDMFVFTVGAESADQLVGKTPLDIWPEEYARHHIQTDEMVISSGKEKRLEELTLTPDGVKWMETIRRPLFNDRGETIGTVGIAHDISRRKRSEKLQAALYHISETASSAQNLDELYKKVHSIIQGLMPADNFFIALHRPHSTEIYFPYFIDQFDPNPGVRDLKIKGGLTEYVIRTGKPILANPQVFERLEKQGEVVNIGSPSVDWLGVPLKTTDKKVIGVLTVQSYTEGMRYKEEEKEILSYVSTQVATAIQRKQTEEALKCAGEAVARHARNMEALYAASLEINAAPDLPTLQQLIVERVVGLLGVQIGGLFLVGSDEQTLELAVNTHLPASLALKRIKMGEGLPGRIAQSGEPEVSIGKQKPENRLERETERHHLSMLGVPLKVQNRVIGVILIASKKEMDVFDAEAIQLVGLFADQAAIAIENARLYAEVKRLAIVDELTGLYNRRGLFELGQREVERSARFGRSLSALFIDIDHFKLFNDAYSYAVGDQALRLLADCMRKNLREIDLVGRYGGEEFVTLLPETDLPIARVVAERLLVAIDAARLHTERGELGITVSIGVCRRSPEMDDLSALIERAGEALHQAKNAGRNQVVSI